jgi:hypothetical protein
LGDRILTWARERTRYGYQRIHMLLRHEGWTVKRPAQAEAGGGGTAPGDAFAFAAE